MNLFDAKQPELLNISCTLRLRKFNRVAPQALVWYQNEETLRLVCRNNPAPFDLVRLKRMYDYLEQHGELYYIECADNGWFHAIGDVTLCPHDLPIVIGDPAYRGKGIGSQVIRALTIRAMNYGIKELYVEDIYDDNIGSRRAFQKCGFTASKKTQFGHSYRLTKTTLTVH
ncbi:GNAT family N-acetyltransferase [Sporolactobacillus shoreicorticis]|uniref:GNAT family N-acetyltransferase n=1 Tax=Sporolactobacillus shoreicorticis TaxID=1923877 RepID=A0ABW5RZE6_9BACL|nr:GNAT family N-acetyltransferase [Sporolactobacillus shoreicorticis]MCO7125208.1 GNAT family N-acetyltransferase [Sporolactobacillus shoreicorticis]